MAKSENSQHIYRMHDPCIQTEFGRRAMTEIGTIKGLELDETVNYILVPGQMGGKNTAWYIHKLTKESDADIVNYKNLD